VVCGPFHADASNIERLLDQRFRWLMTSRERSFNALQLGHEAARRVGVA
jgi:hypothetical protein